mgnify:CR=1 FL=1
MEVCLQCSKGNSIMNHWGRQLKDFVKKKCKGILTISMKCSLYASVQGINDSPFLPHGAVHGLQLHFITKRGGST